MNRPLSLLAAAALALAPLAAQAGPPQPVNPPGANAPANTNITSLSATKNISIFGAQDSSGQSTPPILAISNPSPTQPLTGSVIGQSIWQAIDRPVYCPYSTNLTLTGVIGSVLSFASTAGVSNGQVVWDATNKSGLPSFTTVTSFDGSTVTISKNPVNLTVGDTISFATDGGCASVTTLNTLLAIFPGYTHGQESTAFNASAFLTGAIDGWSDVIGGSMNAASAYPTCITCDYLTTGLDPGMGLYGSAIGVGALPTSTGRTLEGIEIGVNNRSSSKSAWPYEIGILTLFPGTQTASQVTAGFMTGANGGLSSAPDIAFAVGTHNGSWQYATNANGSIVGIEQSGAVVTGSLAAGVLTVESVTSGNLIPNQIVYNDANTIIPNTLITSKLDSTHYSVTGTQTFASGNIKAGFSVQAYDALNVRYAKMGNGVVDAENAVISGSVLDFKGASLAGPVLDLRGAAYNSGNGNAVIDARGLIYSGPFVRANNFFIGNGGDTSVNTLSLISNASTIPIAVNIVSLGSNRDINSMLCGGAPVCLTGMSGNGLSSPPTKISIPAYTDSDKSHSGRIGLYVSGANGGTTVPLTTDGAAPSGTNCPLPFPFGANQYTSHEYNIVVYKQATGALFEKWVGWSVDSYADSAGVIQVSPGALPTPVNVGGLTATVAVAADNTYRCVYPRVTLPNDGGTYTVTASDLYMYAK